MHKNLQNSVQLHTKWKRWKRWKSPLGQLQVSRTINSNSPMFNVTFNMFMLNGTAAHKRGTMTDFKISGNPTTAMLPLLTMVQPLHH
jgi:hypothetical protein